MQMLDEDDSFRLKLFSGNSTSDAKAEEQKKVQGKSTKMSLWGDLARFVFSSRKVTVDLCDQYKADPAHFASSTKQYFAR
jgi:hypothetical protein